MDAQILQDSALLQLLADYPQWVALAIALIAFVESLALVGVVVPGVAMLAAAAFVAGSGALSLQASLICAFIGAICGDGISFLLGRYLQQDIKHMWLLRDHPEWADLPLVLYTQADEYEYVGGSASVYQDEKVLVFSGN